MSREARQLRCPEDVLGWLPWYAESGEAALGDRERGAVEAHAAECAECRAELDMIVGLTACACEIACRSGPAPIDFEVIEPAAATT